MLNDIWNHDAFTQVSLTTAIVELPHQPMRIAASGLFEPWGITTTECAIESRGGVLTLVPNTARGAPAQPKGRDRRTIRKFKVPHLPQRATIMADEVQNVRAFRPGKPDVYEPETIEFVRDDRLAKMKRDLDATIEYHRAGALQGEIKDADGSTILNLFDEFGVIQNTHALVLADADHKVLQSVTAAKRLSEEELGAYEPTGWTAWCGRDFFDAFTGNKRVEDAYGRWMDGEFLRTDNRTGFPFAGVQWAEYRGKTAGGDHFIPAAEAYLVPMGVPDLFITRFAPADYTETVNTIGLPYYAKSQVMDFNKGIEIEAQSNPISLCTRPRAVIKLTLT